MGIDRSRIVGQVDDEVICTICCDVLEAPVRVSLCEHTFCSECIEQWMVHNSTCPVDRRPITKRDLIQPNRVLVALLDRLRVKCLFADHGCLEQLSFASVVLHSDQCAYNPSAEVVCENGCGTHMMRRDREQHKCFVSILRHLDHMKMTFELLNKEVRSIKAQNEAATIQMQEFSEELQRNQFEMNQLKEENNRLKKRVLQLERQNLVNGKEDEKSEEDLKGNEEIKSFWDKISVWRKPGDQQAEAASSSLVSTPNSCVNRFLKSRKLSKRIVWAIDSVDQAGFNKFNITNKYTTYDIDIAILELIDDCIHFDSKILIMNTKNGYLTACLTHILGSPGIIVGINSLEETSKLTTNKLNSSNLMTNRIKIMTNLLWQVDYKENLRLVLGPNFREGPFDVIIFCDNYLDENPDLMDQLKEDGVVLMVKSSLKVDTAKEGSKTDGDSYFLKIKRFKDRIKLSYFLSNDCPVVEVTREQFFGSFAGQNSET